MGINDLNYHFKFQKKNYCNRDNKLMNYNNKYNYYNKN